jgi:hypothetical protein
LWNCVVVEALPPSPPYNEQRKSVV